MAIAGELFGLVLSGGRSSRMGRDKGSLVYSAIGKTQTQRQTCAGLLRPFCEKVFVSCRSEQAIEPELLRILDDPALGEGPGVGILSASRAHPERAWLVLACDFPYATKEDIAQLVSERSPAHDATCFVNEEGFIEPFFSIWEESALAKLATELASSGMSPSRVLSSLRCKKVLPTSQKSLLNVNEAL
jgi:molybdopterin-guanine dinucleotide biosynthesis protein A